MNALRVVCCRVLRGVCVYGVPVIVSCFRFFGGLFGFDVIVDY